MKPEQFFRGAFIFAAFALSIPTQAQAPGAPVPPTLVRLNVLALDSKGDPVTGLGPGDMQVTDQGKAQRIVYFQAMGGAAAKTAPGQISNRGPVPPHATVILFDLMNQGRADALIATKKVGSWLQQLESGEYIYFYILGVDGSLVPVHPIPPDPYVPGADDKTWTKQTEAHFENLMKGMIKARPAGRLQEDDVKKTYVAFETLGRLLTSFSGERSILWVMKDVPSVREPNTTCSGDWLDCALYVPHLSVTLERAGVLVNPVCYANITDPNTNRGMVDFAGLTGARPFFGDDLPTVISRVASDGAGRYVLAYEVPPNHFDNKFHRLKVTCQRKDVKIETRSRYYAYADSRPPGARAVEALTAALKSPFDDPGIGLWGTATPVPGGVKAVHLDVKVDASSLLLREVDGVFTDQVAVIMTGYTAQGVAGPATPSDFNLRLTKEQHATALKEGLPFTPNIPLSDGVKKVRLLIYDYSTGAVGSLSLPVGAP